MVASRQSVGSGRPRGLSAFAAAMPHSGDRLPPMHTAQGEARQIALHYRRSEEEAFVGGRHWRA
jgi:hypothetical protein